MKPYGNAALRAQLALRSQLQPRRLFEGRQTITLVSDTQVQTPDGTCAAEDLSGADQILTRSQGAATITSSASRRAMVQVVSITAGALGGDRHGPDLLLPWDQRVLVRDWRARALFGQPQAVVPAHELVDGEFIRDLGLQMMDLTVLEFSRPHVIYAGGVELSAAAPRQEDLRPAA